MKYLLDTHTVLWLAANSPQLTERARQAILNTENTSYVSIVSAWIEGFPLISADTQFRLYGVQVIW